MLALLWKFKGVLAGAGVIVVLIVAASMLYHKGYAAGIVAQQAIQAKAVAIAEAQVNKAAAIQHAQDVATADALQAQLVAFQTRYAALKPQIITRTLVRPAAVKACPAPFTKAFVDLWNEN